MTDIIITENQSVATFNNIASSYENSLICKVLEQAAEAGISIDMIAQSPATSDKISFGFSFDDNSLPKLLPIIADGETATPLVNSGNVKVTVKSSEMDGNPGFAAKVFSALKKLDCLPLLITTGVDEISLLIRESDKPDFERELRAMFQK